MGAKKKLTNLQLLKRILLVGAAGILAIFLFMVASLIYLSFDLPSIESLEDYNPPQVTRIYSDDGHLVGELGEERRRVASVDSIPQPVIYPFLAGPDVAMTEAAIGSALTTVVFLFALSRLRDRPARSAAADETADSPEDADGQ